MQIKVLLYASDASLNSYECGGTDRCLMRYQKNDLERLPGSSLTLIFTLTLECTGAMEKGKVDDSCAFN